jgi:hypothetical protein
VGALGSIPSLKWLAIEVAPRVGWFDSNPHHLSQMNDSNNRVAGERFESWKTHRRQLRLIALFTFRDPRGFFILQLQFWLQF